MRKFKVNVNGVSYDVTVDELNAGEQHIDQAVEVPAQPIKKETSPNTTSNDSIKQNNNNVKEGEKVLAPMPGTIVDINVTEGKMVKTGDVLVVLEAMKMENEIVAPRDAKVVQISTSKGASVNTGDILVVLE